MHQLPSLRSGLFTPAISLATKPRQAALAAQARAPAHAWLALALAILPLAQAWGQAGPIAAGDQELRREQERERVLREQLERRPDVHLPSAAPAPDATRLRFDETPCFKIERIVLDGAAADQFAWALDAADQAAPHQIDAATGHCLGTRAIDLVLRRVQNAILRRGYVTTRVLVAPQDLRTGTLTLSLIPGRIRAIRTLPGSDPRATLWNAVPAAPGDLLKLRDVEQALENFKRVPTADADIQIMPSEAPGAGPGESDLGIKWKQDKRWRLALSADDSGSEPTGKYQGGVTLSLDHALQLNDLFYISLNHDLGGAHDGRGTRAATAHYSLPYGYWLLGTTVSNSAYHQTVAGASQDYRYSGSSWNGDLKLSRLVFRDADSKSTLSVRGWERASRNFIDDTEVQVQRRRMAGWEAGFEQRNTFGAATMEMHVNYRRGTGAMHAEHAPEEAFGDGTSRFALVTADANLSVPFALAKQNLRYSAAWRIQENRTPLLAQDRFAIGGRYTVRGFDGVSSLVAERGWLLRNELSVTCGAPGQELYVGLDHGEVSGPSSAALLGKSLTGAVLGWRAQFHSVQYEVFAGVPVHKPAMFRTVGSTAGFSMNLNY
jgi:hemolysin activation/secretion protein